jgi:hypothetical protein
VEEADDHPDDAGPDRAAIQAETCSPRSVAPSTRAGATTRSCCRSAMSEPVSFWIRGANSAGTNSRPGTTGQLQTGRPTSRRLIGFSKRDGPDLNPFIERRGNSPEHGQRVTVIISIFEPADDRRSRASELRKLLLGEPSFRTDVKKTVPPVRSLDWT